MRLCSSYNPLSCVFFPHVLSSSIPIIAIWVASRGWRARLDLRGPVCSGCSLQLAVPELVQCYVPATQTSQAKQPATFAKFSSHNGRAGVHCDSRIS
ncbi:hypothetical protein FKP32DRAFT_1590263 [Trametes sanguinea]|nr:hypothetical protein FKP32DRAFT_1590263 [Trametes sanguinea]